MSDLGFPGSSVAKNPLAKAGDMDSILGSGRYPGVGNGNPLQYSCWKISWTKEPGRLQSIESQKVKTQLGDETSDSVHIFTYGNSGICLFILEHLHLGLATRHLPVYLSLYPLSCKFLDGGNHILLTSFVKLPAELPGHTSS